MPTRDPLAVARSEFPAATVRLAGEGQLSTALLVDDLIVRYPKHAFGVDRLRFEVQLLDVLRPRLATTVPTIVRAELDRPLGEAFVAHRALAGDVLTADRVHCLALDELQLVAAQIAGFLKELHGLRDAARSVGVPVRSPAGFAADLAAEVDELLRDRMTPRSRERARRELAGLAAAGDAAPALCHTDIGGNVLFDSATGAVAVIDFGSCFITDPALDVASLSVLGEDLVAECARHYPVISESRGAAVAVRQTFVLQDALYGARQGDWDHVDDVLRAYAASS